MMLCLGREGRLSNTPLRNLQTNGCVPKLMLLDKVIIDDKALLAVFRAL